MNIEMLRQIPDFHKWESASPDDVFYMFELDRRVVNFVSALRKIDPDVRLVEGLLVIEDGMDVTSVLDAFKRGDMTAPDAEYYCNRRRIKDMFFHDPTSDDVGLDVYNSIADEIIRYWEFNLLRKFPEHSIKFVIINQDFSPEVTFYVER